ncbi:hypothetical protein QO010_000361 [Caulobacter ginsengisoli]|uniref:Uncharacterized protein n=1 Tax=Caulobacter ginsengisoli TaxID=400775 RepID=A0ABU0IN79_9CAUL|nr:hypothetical protein [Caulobacter ginsengisoli]MDQ0462613.1 hypothetical protein [Caulobacter ginsengisoli]
MSRKRKLKPKSPAEIAAERLSRRARDFEAVGLAASAAALASNDAVDVRREGRTHTLGARRLDAFEALREGMAAGAYDAVRRLERDLTIRAGEHDRGRAMVRVDCDMGLGPGRTDQMLAAGQRVDAVLGRIGRRDGWLLLELLRPTPETRIALPTWRAVVAHITGEENDRGQAAIVRNICANLAEAYAWRERAA